MIDELEAFVRSTLRSASEAGVEYGEPTSWRRDADGSVIAVTSVGQKVRIAADGTTEILMGPGYVAPDVLAAPAPEVAPAPTPDPAPLVEQPGYDLPVAAAAPAPEAVSGDLPALGEIATTATTTTAVPISVIVGDVAGVIQLDRVERFRGEDGQWYFRGIAGNGEIVYPSEGYADKRGAGNAGRSLAKRFGVPFVEG